MKGNKMRENMHLIQNMVIIFGLETKSKNAKTINILTGGFIETGEKRTQVGQTPDLNSIHKCILFCRSKFDIKDL